MSRNKDYQRLLNSKRWKVTRTEYLMKHPLCEDCQAKGFVYAAVDVHHVVPCESAKTLGEMETLCFAVSNLRALCIPCHIKTHKESKSHTTEGHKQREADRLEQWIARNTNKC